MCRMLRQRTAQAPAPSSATSATPTSAPRSAPINISPTYTRVISNNSVFNLGAFVRRDGYNYYPSGNPLADLGPANLQTSSISQYRTLTNAGGPCRLLLRQGNQQPQDRRAIRTDLPARARQPGRGRSHLQLALRRCQRQPAAGLHQIHPQCDGVTSFSESATISRSWRPTTSPAAERTTTTSATPT